MRQVTPAASNHMRFWILVGVVAFLIGCGAETSPQIVTLQPTSPAADATLAPTQTPIPTSVPVLPTVTPGPTQTPRPFNTLEGGANPLQPTFTPAPITPTVTSEALAAVNADAVQIEFFLTNDDVEALSPSDSVTVFWRIVGADAGRLFRLNADGQRVEVWDVAADGRLTVDVTSEDTADETQASFLLRAGAGNPPPEATLTFSLGCAANWFFLPPPSACAAAPPLFSQQVEQRFENGIMLWLASSREIYVFMGATANRSAEWRVYEDTYEDGLPLQDDTLVAPPDRLQPVRGFGMVWRENEDVRARLGWALEPEFGYDGIIQPATDDTVYLQERGGSVIVAYAETGNWEVLTAVQSNLQPTSPDLIIPDEASQSEE